MLGLQKKTILSSILDLTHFFIIIISIMIVNFKVVFFLKKICQIGTIIGAYIEFPLTSKCKRVFKNHILSWRPDLVYILQL